MCGRYQFSVEQCEEIQRIAEMIDQKYGAGAWQPGEIRPTAKAPVLLAGKSGMEPELMSWGYRTAGPLVINARAETAAERRTFRESVLHRRCVIPAKGFWEWNKSKEKFSFERPDAQVMFMAGCYDCFDGQERFVILTTQANASVRGVHPRMPLILELSEAKEWLREDCEVSRLLAKTPEELMREPLGQLSLFL